VCISILHSQSEPANEHEPSETRWRPILTPEDVLISIISMLSEPNINSPANVDASVQYRDRPEDYKKKVRRLIDQALENL
jgi:ubiquitin-protein ligase